MLLPQVGGLADVAVGVDDVLEHFRVVELPGRPWSQSSPNPDAHVQLTQGALGLNLEGVVHDPGPGGHHGDDGAGDVDRVEEAEVALEPVVAASSSRAR